MDSENCEWLYSFNIKCTPADSEAHGYEHPEDDEMPVAGAESDQEAGQGEGQGPGRQHHRPRQPLVQEVGQDGQEHGREDEDQDEGGARQHLEKGGVVVLDDKY